MHCGYISYWALELHGHIDTYMYLIGNALTESEDNTKAEEHYPLVPDGAIYVDLTHEVKKSGDLYHFNYGGNDYAGETL